MNIRLAEDTLGQRIKAYRIKMGMSQDELAEIMNIPKKTLSGYECDRVDIKSSVIVDLARCLETTPNYLLGYEENTVIKEITEILRNMTDEKVKEMLLIQIKALAGIR